MCRKHNSQFLINIFMLYRMHRRMYCIWSQHHSICSSDNICCHKPKHKPTHTYTHKTSIIAPSLSFIKQVKNSWHTTGLNDLWFRTSDWQPEKPLTICEGIIMLQAKMTKFEFEIKFGSSRLCEVTGKYVKCFWVQLYIIWFD